MSSTQFSRFKDLDFEKFREMAQDPNLSHYEKVGFPVAYREGKGEIIFADILSKLTRLQAERELTVVDIGPGCSDLAFLMIEICRQQGHKLTMVDSQEMLSQLPDEPFITKVPGHFPDECPQLIADFAGKVDIILAYSMVQIVFEYSNVYKFLDSVLSLMAEGAQCLFGDMPNISKRKRFFSSSQGVRFHQDFMKTDELPQVNWNTVEPAQMDDAAFYALMMRARLAGFDSYILPQGPNLPLANRREDILIVRP